MIEEGKKAPDFTLPDQAGEKLKLSELRGAPVVLYFYPRADTPGCTTQACGVRDHRGDYKKAGARVLGVSPDSVEDVANFHDKFDLDFTLLADADHKIAEKYGTWVEKNNYGKKYMGVQRSTFIIGTDGVVAKVFKRVKPAEHDEKVLAALADLSGAGA